MKRNTKTHALLSAVCFAIAAGQAHAQSFSIDDNPFFAVGGFGYGAEDEFGLTPGPGLAPSPSLGLTFGGDASMISPAIGGVEHTPGPRFLDAFSTNHYSAQLLNQEKVRLDFSVDRITTGLPGSASLAESAVGQQPGDIYSTTAGFINPIAFVGALAAAPYAGPLASAGVGGSNVLTTDESAFGLTTAAGIVPAGVAAGPITPGSHDNVDAYDTRPVVAVPGAPVGVYATDSYFAMAPDSAAVAGLSAADIFHTPAGSIAGGGLFAPSVMMGLDTNGHNTDSIDALIIFDGPNADGTLDGVVEPGKDFALFSLAPGSASLGGFGLSAGEVFFTDFTGAFGTYAFDTDLGLFPGAPGFPFQQQTNVDALSVVPEPNTMALIALGTALIARRRKDA